ncbi:MAG: ribonucleoside-diphosphate reductase, adenosylcobalamin-dependent [Nitrosomonadales bacterium]|nr:MAG: ribonucleoside-diphosphate reductase, adenosylcobalamin-dependent [Nitrosomonadales bacterium]
MSDHLSQLISRKIWEEKYRYRERGEARDATIEDSWRRVARALAAAEKPECADEWAARFYGLLQDFKFLPGGRILAGAGTRHRVTLFNCFVMGRIEDSIAGIFETLKESALTMQQGGGIGLDFSTLRPRGMVAQQVGAVASGPLSFMHIWDSMCGTILSTGARRGAMMATMSCDHPDIEAFIDAKRDPHALRHFNLSVLVSDAFMAAVEEDSEWPLLFPLAQDEETSGEIIERHWPGSEAPQRCRVFRRVRARELWERLMRAAYDCAEPGVIFIGRVNRHNNLWYCEHINATNPCGEIPLPPDGACNLGSLNLTRFVHQPFTPMASLDLDGLSDAAALAARMLDNVYEASHFPLPQQAAAARATRRLGLGITGLADALIMLGLRYGSPESLRCADEIMARICHAAYRTSTRLAQEKGAFPKLELENYLRAAFVSKLPADIQRDIRKYGIRNSHLTAIAPTGTISLLAGNVSSGLEPVYDWRCQRTVRAADGNPVSYETQDYAYALFRALHGENAPLPPAFVTAAELPPSDHLAMQAVLQNHVDNAISKTVNVPEALDFSAFGDLYLHAYRLGLKGCTVFRPNPVTGQVLSASAPSRPERGCCSLEREAD